MANQNNNADHNSEQKSRNYIQIGRLYGLGGRSAEYAKAYQELDEHLKNQQAFMQQQRTELENYLKQIEQRLMDHQKIIVSHSSSTRKEFDEMLSQATTALSVLQVSEWTPDNLRIIMEGIQRNFVNNSNQLTGILTQMISQAANLVNNFDYNGQLTTLKEKFEEYANLVQQVEQHKQELQKGYREGDSIKNAFKKPGA